MSLVSRLLIDVGSRIQSFSLSGPESTDNNKIIINSCSYYILRLFSSKTKTSSLHMADDTIVITPDHLHVDQVTEIVGSPSAGAISMFVGKLKTIHLLCVSLIILLIAFDFRLLI